MDFHWTTTNETKTDEVSKKLSEKLLQGWAMLDKAC